MPDISLTAQKVQAFLRYLCARVGPLADLTPKRPMLIHKRGRHDAFRC